MVHVAASGHAPGATGLLCASSRRAVDAVAGTFSGALLVRSLPGGGSAAVVCDVTQRLRSQGVPVTEVTEIASLRPDEHPALRQARRSTVVVMGTEVADRGPASLVTYLRPIEVEVAPVTLGEVVALAPWLPDDGAARVMSVTDGRLGDVLDLLAHLDGDPWASLVDFHPTCSRLGTRLADEEVHRWALLAAHGVAAVPADRPAGVRPVDAHVVAAMLSPEHRRQAVASVIASLGRINVGDLAPREAFALALWACEVTEPAASGPHLDLLTRGGLAAIELGFWEDVLPIVERVWALMPSAFVATGASAALSRCLPDDPVAERFLQEMERHADAGVRGAAAQARAAQQFFVDEDAAVAEATIAAARLDDEAPDLLAEGIAMLAAHGGRPHDTERLVAEFVGSGRSTTFGFALVMVSDLYQGHHQSLLDRLDAELERIAKPGANLTVERARTTQLSALVSAGWAGDDVDAELRALYEQVLELHEPWAIGWIGHAVGTRAMHRGRFVEAERCLRTSARGFERSHRAGFARWSWAALVQLEAMLGYDNGDAVDDGPLRVTPMAVLSHRGEADLALAMRARASGAPPPTVARLLHDAMTGALTRHEHPVAARIAVEEWLAGCDVEPCPDDPLFDGVLRTAWDALSAGRAEKAGLALVGQGWEVLGARVLTRVADQERTSNPRAAARLLQLVRTTTDRFDRRLASWALPQMPLPTLSPREVQIAEWVVAGRARDDIARELVVSKRTVDAHVQRIYAKLGISGRDELRDVLAR
jgi:DNA-binding CsgD family transcriptional regulator